MKNVLAQFKEVKEGFLTAKTEEHFPAYALANAIFIFFVYIIICTISTIIYNFFQVVGICMIAISIIFLYVFLFQDKASSLTMPISMRILDYFLQDMDQQLAKMIGNG